MKRNPLAPTETENTKAVRNALCVNHQGKMSGMQSLSTSLLANEHCIRRRANGDTICAECFSYSYNEIREALREKLIRNTDLLTSKVIPTKEMPLLNVAFFRLEAFGDLNNGIQVENYFNLCKRNKHATFALWTKNPFIIRELMRTKGIKKPSNLIISFSSPLKNTPVNMKVLKTVYPFIDKVFTVYDKEHAADVDINCGANHCLSCLRCYSKRTTNIINEKLK